MTGKLRAYLDHLKQAYPDLGASKAEFAAEGQNNDVLIVNDEFVFRFPRHDDGVGRLETECAVLNGIRPYITSVEVPDPMFTDLFSPAGKSIHGL